MTTYDLHSHHLELTLLGDELNTPYTSNSSQTHRLRLFFKSPRLPKSKQPTSTKHIPVPYPPHFKILEPKPEHSLYKVQNTQTQTRPKPNKHPKQHKIDTQHKQPPPKQTKSKNTALPHFITAQRMRLNYVPALEPCTRSPTVESTRLVRYQLQSRHRLSLPTAHDQRKHDREWIHASVRDIAAPRARYPAVDT